MKNRKALLVLCLAAALAATGCGNKGKDSSEATSTSSAETASSASSADSTSTSEEDTTPLVDGDFELEDCITLCDYKGLKLTREVEAVTDEDVESYITSMMSPEVVTDASAVVEEGDTVNIDYEGTKDGVAFDGGTSTGYDLVIGSDSFIDGFEDGLIGMKAGESRDLDLTFPEDYQAEDLAGAAVVFHVTVNTISRVPDLTDAWVVANTDGEYTTAAEYRQNARENLETNNENTALQNLRQTVWTQLEENSTFKQLPSSYVEEGQTEFEDNVTQEASYYGYELEDYVVNAGLTMDEYNSKKEQYGRSVAKSRLLLDALVQAEKVSTEDQEYKEALDTLAESYSMDADTLVDTYGQDTVEQYILTSLVLDRVIGYADVTDATAAE